jgi:hypothetical protein
VLLILAAPSNGWSLYKNMIHVVSQNKVSTIVYLIQFTLGGDVAVGTMVAIISLSKTDIIFLLWLACVCCLCATAFLTYQLFIIWTNGSFAVHLIRTDNSYGDKYMYRVSY